MEIKGREFQRPLTHDLLFTAVKALGGEIRKAEVASLKDTTYYARITIQRGDELIAIDARPSDSIALALRAKAPIFAARDLLTHELDDALPEEGLEPERSAPAEVSPEERAERIRRRIEEIDPEDFGKFSF